MAIMTSEEVRNFASRLESMVGKMEGDLDQLQQSVRSVGGGWQDERCTEFSAELASLCRSLDPFYDDARTYSKNLNEKANLNDRTAGHRTS